MLERLVKLKPYARELAEHADFHNKCTLFTPNQWNLAGGLITLLSPVRVLTKFTQERPPRPGFAGFEIARCEHELSTVPVNGLGTTKETMLNAYSNRLTEYKGSKPYFMASLLDINMKGCHLNPGEKVIAYDTLKRDIGAHITRTRPAPPPAVQFFNLLNKQVLQQLGTLLSYNNYSLKNKINRLVFTRMRVHFIYSHLKSRKDNKGANFVVHNYLSIHTMCGVFIFL